jgi:hypothetical protein
MDIECPLCQQAISPDDTVMSVGYGMAHVDCGRPRSLRPDEHVLLYVYCWNHAVAECAACDRSFRQEELGSDPFGSCTCECLHCRADLTASIRAHLTACAILPEQLRRRVKAAREITQRLLKRSYQLSERADVLMREVEAALDALHETLDRPNRKCDEQ